MEAGKTFDQLKTHFHVTIRKIVTEVEGMKKGGDSGNPAGKGPLERLLDRVQAEVENPTSSAVLRQYVDQLATTPPHVCLRCRSYPCACGQVVVCEFCRSSPCRCRRAVVCEYCYSSPCRCIGRGQHIDCQSQGMAAVGPLLMLPLTMLQCVATALGTLNRCNCPRCSGRC